MMFKVQNKDLEISKQFSNLLDFLRWISAFFVVIGHLRSVIFCNYKEVLSSNIFLKIFYFFTGFGHEAVLIFFILSGYLISGSIFRDVNNNSLNFGKYFTNRFSRIYIVYIPAMILTLFLDNIGLNYFNQSGIYTHHLSIASIPFDISSRNTVKYFLGNLFMLQTSYFPTLGSNGPLWSLAYEFWYYIIFFLIIKLSIAENRFEKKIMPLLVLILIVLTLNKIIIFYFFIWLMGVLIYKLNDLKKTIRLLLLLFLPIILIMMRFSTFNFFKNQEMEMIKDFIFAAYLMFLINSFKNIKSSAFTMSPFHTKSANFSYSLYLIHFPILILITSIINSQFNIGFLNQPSLFHFIYFILLLIILYTLAWRFSKFTEARTKMVRDKLMIIFKVNNN